MHNKIKSLTNDTNSKVANILSTGNDETPNALDQVLTKLSTLIEEQNNSIEKQRMHKKVILTMLSSTLSKK